MIIAQITDSHVEAAGQLAYGRYDTAASLRSVIAAINERDPQPDLVLHTGDVVHHGSKEQYAPLRALLGELKAPFCAIPGNHDSRDGFRSGFADTAWLPDGGTFIHYVIERFPVRIICLDTVIPGSPNGALCEVRLAWLAQQLAAAPDRPTVIACHHPPVATGLTGSTAVGLEDGGAELASILRENPQVQRVICGHAHRLVSAVFGGCPAWISPGTCYQFEANMGPDRVLAMVGEPPGYSLHVWLDDPVAGPNLASHFVPVGDFGERIELLRDGKRVASLPDA
jgi:3',5'-cyclic-AMP phosphodiesterase